MQQYYLIADRTGTILAVGSREQCEFAMQAMLTYGVAADRLFVAPSDYFDNITKEDV